MPTLDSITNNLSQSAKEALFNAIRDTASAGEVFVNVSGDTMTGPLTLSGGLLVGTSGPTITQILMSAATLSPTAIGGATTVEQTFTVAVPLQTSHTVVVNKPTSQAGLVISNVRVSAASTLAIAFTNVSSATITPTADELYRFVAIR